MNWEVFIAYHGSFDGNKGSAEKAREIYDFLKGQNGVNCYFYPECGEGKFGNTPKEASHSRLFLLVANSTILNKIDKENGEIREGEPIYEEMDAFYQNRMHSRKGNHGILRVYCFDGFRDFEADTLFPVATKNVEHFDEKRDGGEEKSFTKVLEWIMDATINPGNQKIMQSQNVTEKNIVHKPHSSILKPKQTNRPADILHYAWKQYSWIIIDMLVFLFSGFVFFYYLKPSEIYKPMHCILFWITVGVIVLLFSIYSWFNRFFSMGFKKIFCSSVCGEAKPSNIMKSSKRKIRFLGIASSKWLSDEKLFKDTLMRLCSDDCGGMEFLLLNPNSEYAKRMDLACKTGDKLTSDSINQCLEKISRIVNEVCTEKGLYEIKAFSVRLYSHYPIYRIIVSDDDRIFLGFYSAGINGNNNYQIKVDGHKKNDVYPCLINYYNQLWNDESTVEYNF